MSSSYLSRTEVQQLLGINSFGLWRLVRKYDDFPQPTEPPHDPFAGFGHKKEPEEVWDGFQVYRWAAHTPEFARRGAVLLRPIPEEVPPGQWAGCKDTVRGPALDWHTALGVIRIVHCDDRKVATDVATNVAGGGNPDGVVTVCALYGDADVVICTPLLPDLVIELDSRPNPASAQKLRLRPRRRRVPPVGPLRRRRHRQDRRLDGPRPARGRTRCVRCRASSRGILNGMDDARDVFTEGEAVASAAEYVTNSRRAGHPERHGLPAG
ncbi:hypothetical protein [Streptomyces griseofuscus]|uniref:hypothetical protein n=1 Tax=Streptomyces griseofuscus TaxID=146922 RepID=UPI003830B3D2